MFLCHKYNENISIYNTSPLEYMPNHAFLCFFMAFGHTKANYIEIVCHVSTYKTIYLFKSLFIHIESLVHLNH